MELGALKNKYTDLIHQTFDFPQEGFSVTDNELNFHDIPLMDIIKQYGTPLRITYLPKIGQQIQKARKLFNVARYPSASTKLLLHKKFPFFFHNGRSDKI